MNGYFQQTVKTCLPKTPPIKFHFQNYCNASKARLDTIKTWFGNRIWRAWIICFIGGKWVNNIVKSEWMAHLLNLPTHQFTELINQRIRKWERLLTCEGHQNSSLHPLMERWELFNGPTFGPIRSLIDSCQKRNHKTKKKGIPVKWKHRVL